MGNQEEAEKQQTSFLNIENWPLYQDQHPPNFIISGLFYNEYQKSRIHYQTFFAEDQHIYFYHERNIRYIPLFFTKMEEKFYLDNGKNIYALKLTHNSQCTILSTADREIFIVFYCYLAQYCILSDFERHFEVKQEIGKGSYGTVYRGVNRLSNEQVALKVFYKNKMKQNICCKKVVQNQIYVLNRLKKSHLSPLYEIFETSDCLVLVIEMAKKGDLLSFLLKEETVVDQKLIKDILKKILQNIDALHSAGFIHRDIKPENVIFRQSNCQVNLLLCDFSISIAIGDAFCEEMKNMQAGSKGFAAPEVLINNIYDHKCDMFSFGCLIYILLTGKKLFENIPNQQILFLVEDNNYIRREVQRLKASKPLKNLLNGLLETDPVKRMDALQALNSEYFNQKDAHRPFIMESDETLKEFIQKRMRSYESSTTRGTSF